MLSNFSLYVYYIHVYINSSSTVIRFGCPFFSCSEGIRLPSLCFQQLSWKLKRYLLDCRLNSTLKNCVTILNSKYAIKNQFVTVFLTIFNIVNDCEELFDTRCYNVLINCQFEPLLPNELKSAVLYWSKNWTNLFSIWR